MQRNENGQVVISCDFCGTDWDQVRPMIEGHRGSVICLDCVKQAIADESAPPSQYSCTMCIRDQLPTKLKQWEPNPRPQAANPTAIICHDCLQQASQAFHRDNDVPWSKPQ